MVWANAIEVLGAIGLTGALSAWVWGYLGDFLPPPKRLERAVRNEARRLLRHPVTTIDHGRFRLVLCALDGDDVKESTFELLRKALNPEDYPMLQVSLSAVCIKLE